MNHCYPLGIQTDLESLLAPRLLASTGQAVWGGGGYSQRKALMAADIGVMDYGFGFDIDRFTCWFNCA